MKYIPILFSAPMVKAILEGRKTMTRRIGKRYEKWQKGERIWVRETWVPTFQGLDCLYKADEVGNEMFPVDKWRPSIFMPRWASRITLEIVSLRDERLQDITPDDAEKEGIPNPCGYYCDDTVGHVDHYGTVNRFHDLWDSLNAKRGYGWDTNPMVKVIEFKRVK